MGDVSLVSCVHCVDVLHIVQVKQVRGALAVVHVTSSLGLVCGDDLKKEGWVSFRGMLTSVNFFFVTN